ncbi:dihydrofolate reductase family protein [Gordonia amicalis]|uniref:dihydrofolate reductase family protein n=1 Tax=Gordonia amicalis TaxID=89053 RepID=UPI001EDE6919|nr:dihydrofolate reductase family protein [Gordonia amicalis]MDV7099732.1 dihydrofolate reductase family protein [Gordonia amicalis]UKO91074.1 dihydrofolate reductase family protein [Gordonia amicalis]
MATTIYSATASLDGFIAGPGGDMSWLTRFFGEDEDNSAARRLRDQTGSLLVGNRSFGGDDPNKGTDREGAFEGEYQGPTVVLTHNPPADPVEGVTFVTDLHRAVAEATRMAGDGYVTVIGADVARQMIDAGLLDEVLVFHVPVFLGDGVRIFDRPGGGEVRLTRIPGETEFWCRVER